MLIRGALEARQLFIRNAKIDDTVLELLQVFHAFQRLQQTPLRAGGLVWNWLPMEEEGLVRLRPSETHLLRLKLGCCLYSQRITMSIQLH